MYTGVSATLRDMYKEKEFVLSKINFLSFYKSLAMLIMKNMLFTFVSDA